MRLLLGLLYVLCVAIAVSPYDLFPLWARGAAIAGSWIAIMAQVDRSRR
jgi:hypothetical protein